MSPLNQPPAPNNAHMPPVRETIQAPALGKQIVVIATTNDGEVVSRWKTDLDRFAIRNAIHCAGQKGAVVSGPFSLIVPAADAAKARRVLKSVANPPCPKCHSPQTAPQPVSLPAFLLSLALFCIPFFFMRKRWKCTHCGFQWLEAKEAQEGEPEPRKRLENR